MTGLTGNNESASTQHSLLSFTVVFDTKSGRTVPRKHVLFIEAAHNEAEYTTDFVGHFNSPTFIRPPDIVVGGLIFYQRSFFLSFLFLSFFIFAL